MENLTFGAEYLSEIEAGVSYGGRVRNVTDCVNDPISGETYCGGGDPTPTPKK